MAEPGRAGAVVGDLDLEPVADAPAADADVSGGGAHGDAVLDRVLDQRLENQTRHLCRHDRSAFDVDISTFSRSRKRIFSIAR